jgi:hypothetical protein
MWDTVGLPLKPVAGRHISPGAPCSHQRTWAENDGRSPRQLYVSSKRFADWNTQVSKARTWATHPSCGGRFSLSNRSARKHRPSLCHLDCVDALSWKCSSTGNPRGSAVKRSTVLPSAIGLGTGVADSRMQFVIFSVGKSAPIEQLLSLGSNAPSLCHLDRSEAQRRDLCVDTLSWKCFSGAA